MEKIKRKCAVCGKNSMLNRSHSLDTKSMGEALYCKKCRSLTVEERQKIKNS